MGEKAANMIYRGKQYQSSNSDNVVLAGDISTNGNLSEVNIA